MAHVKLAISLPQALGVEADALARALGTSRSALIAQALEEFVARHRDERVVTRVNAVVDDVAAHPAEQADEDAYLERVGRSYRGLLKRDQASESW